MNGATAIMPRRSANTHPIQCRTSRFQKASNLLSIRKDEFPAEEERYRRRDRGRDDDREEIIHSDMRSEHIYDRGIDGKRCAIDRDVERVASAIPGAFMA